MEKIKELFSKHPYLIGGGALVVFVVVYYLFSRSGGSSTVTASGTSTDAQTNALNAQENIAQLQSQTALAAKQIDAGVAAQQISAAQDVTKYQTDAQVKALFSNNDTQVQIAKVQADSNMAQVKALEDIVTAQYTSQEHASDNTLAYLNNLTNAQAYVQSQAIQTQGQLDMASLSHVKDVGGSQNRTAIILGATGNIQGSVAAAQGQTASSISGDNLLGTVAKSVASLFA